MPINTRKVEDRTIKSTGTDAQTEEHEVAQRTSGTGPTGDADAARTPADKAPSDKQTAGPQHESRENPGAGVTSGQSGTNQKHEKREQPASENDGKAMSQNGARITDFDQS